VVQQPSDDLFRLASDDFLPAGVFHLARELRNAIERELAPLDVTSQQAALILVAHLHRGVPLARLAGSLGTDTAGMTRLVDRLEAKGLVVRRVGSRDRRQVAIQLTDTGQALAPALAAAFERVNHRLLDGVTPMELGRFRMLMKRLRQNAGRHDDLRAEATC
jgi:DNA-binding MarR family transcriptional regulator